MANSSEIDGGLPNNSESETMDTTPRPNYSLGVGLKISGRGIVEMAKTNMPVFLWVNFFGTWFIGGGALMLYLGSTSVLPLVCVLTPIASLIFLVMISSKYGFSRLLGLPRALPWLVAMAIAIQEFASGTYVDQPSGYYTFLLGFIIINAIATLLDFIDILRWYRGERTEQFNTGFFNEA
jgi:hypothetical protein